MSEHSDMTLPNDDAAPSSLPSDALEMWGRKGLRRNQAKTEEDPNAFRHITPADFLLFYLLLQADNWLRRTVEKIDLITETEYNHKASFLISITTEAINDSLLFLDDASSYWKDKKDENWLASLDVLKAEVKKAFTGSQLYEMVIPMFSNPKDPLVELDIRRENSGEIIEVLNRKQASQRSLSLLDLSFKLSTGSDFVEKNAGLITDILCCYPNIIEYRHHKSQYLKDVLRMELQGYLNGRDLNELTTLLDSGKYDKDLFVIFFRSRALCRLLLERYKYERLPIWATPLYLIRDDYKSFRSDCSSFEVWYSAFLLRCKSFLQTVAKQDRSMLNLLYHYNDRYILFVKTNAALNTPILIKYASKKINDIGLLKWDIAKGAVDQLGQRGEAASVTKFILKSPLRYLAYTYFFLARIYFVAKIDLLGQADSYHLEFSTNDNEATIQAYILQYEVEGKARSEDLERHFGVNKIDQGHLHIYTSKHNFYTGDGKPIDAHGYRLFIWPFIRRLPACLFFSVSIVELIGLYLLDEGHPYYQAGNILGIGIISIVGTLTIRYSPGNVAACFIRRWKRIVTVGLLTTVGTFVTITLLTDYAVFTESVRIRVINLIKGASFLLVGFWYLYEFLLSRYMKVKKKSPRQEASLAGIRFK